MAACGTFPVGVSTTQTELRTIGNPAVHPIDGVPSSRGSNERRVCYTSPACPFARIGAELATDLCSEGRTGMVVEVVRVKNSGVSFVVGNRITGCVCGELADEHRLDNFVGPGRIRYGRPVIN